MHEFDLQNNVSIETVLSTLRSQGVVRFPDAKFDVSQMKDEILSVYDKMEEDPSYTFGKALRTDQNWNISSTPSIEMFCCGSPSF